MAPRPSMKMVSAIPSTCSSAFVVWRYTEGKQLYALL